ncbi:DUF4342 domain-containing protein [Ornithinimicrobium sp. Y1847]|uniref:DUF4342 domain-containing protein n=1 Tax=unclassified Ornithinimicrobium TaxID=2615080 RepID=UPI003B675136
MTEPTGRTWTERMEVAGSDLLGRVKDLAKDADAKRVIIKNDKDEEMLAFPLSWGVAGGALAVVAAPMLAAVAAIGGAVANVKLEVERREPAPEDDVPGSTATGGSLDLDENGDPPPLPRQP